MSARTARAGATLTTRLVIVVLCALVGFTVVAQAQQRPKDSLAGLRQAELVRLIDEINSRVDLLENERDKLRRDLERIDSGANSRAEAVAASQERIRVLTIQAGVVPVRGPGIELIVRDPRQSLKAQNLVTLIEELRNAGAEAIEVNGVRVGTGTWFSLHEGKMRLESQEIGAPYTVRAIGDPNVLSVALEMPGGVLAAFRAAGATTHVNERNQLEIRSVRPSSPLKHAKFAE